MITESLDKYPDFKKMTVQREKLSDKVIAYVTVYKYLLDYYTK